MFQAVRKWWNSGRGQHTVRLFAFELTVVMIGVLAAQQVSNWAQRRSAEKEVESLHDDLLHNFEIYRRIALTQQAAIPCLEQQIGAIQKVAAGSRPLSPSLLNLANIASMSPDQMPPDAEQSLRDRYGDFVTTKITSMQFNLRVNDDSNKALDKEWYQFERIDPANGPVSANDRAAVREAAAQIRGSLAGLRSSADLIVRLTGMLGIRANPHAELQPVSCAVMWRTGKAFTGG